MLQSGSPGRLNQELVGQEEASPADSLTVENLFGLASSGSLQKIIPGRRPGAFCSSQICILHILSDHALCVEI